MASVDEPVEVPAGRLKFFDQPRGVLLIASTEFWERFSYYGFIGLIAPHLMRPLVGYDPAKLLVPSALSGAALLLAADVAVRIIPSTSDIKVGVLTSLIGVPFFLYLIVRERRALGGGVA